jgi:Zn-dependent protease/CBS domain-containing protein
MAAEIRIGRILGIPVYLHLTFLIILPLFVYLFSAPRDSVTMFGIQLNFTELDAALWVKYAFGTLATIIFFMTILIHELAHSYLARSYGVKIRSITLMLFGGVSAMEDIPRDPRQEWRMAFAGPFSSLTIGGVSLLLMFAIDPLTDGSVAVEGVTILLGLMAVYNLLLAGFNLIPAFPMDGGRVLRAYFASRMPYLDATMKAARIGRYFAIGMGILGIFTLNFFLILIALFVYIGASEEEQAVTITESLHGIQVRQLMTDAVQVVHPDMTIQQLHEIMLATGHMGFPVVENGLVGVVAQADTAKLPREALSTTRIRDIMVREPLTVSPDTDASKALRLMYDRRMSRLMVMDQGRLVGIVTHKDFMRAVNYALSRKRGTVWGEQFPPQPPPASPV